MYIYIYLCFCFFFNDTATTEIYTLSLHDALPISVNFHVWVDMGVATALAVWMMLAYASLMEVAQTWNLISFWTYVMETRYYAPAML